MSYRVITAEIVRDGQCTPWGFRLSGGADIGTPLIVQKINYGSPAADGLQRGDIIVSIASHDVRKMSHQKASELIAKAGNNLKLVIARSGSSHSSFPMAPPTTSVRSPITLYHLQSTPSPSPAFAPLMFSAQNDLLRPLPKTEFHNDIGGRTAAAINQQQISNYDEKEAIVNQAYRTLPLIKPDLKTKQDAPVGSYLRFSRDTSGRSACHKDPYMLTKVQEAVLEAASTSPRTSFSSSRTSTPDIGYSTNPNVCIKQYNSPINLYSNQALVEALNAQTSVTKPVSNGLPRVQSPSKAPLDLSKSPTYQLIHEEEWKDLNKQKLLEHEPVENKIHNLEEIPKSGFNFHEEIHQSSSFKVLMSALKSPASV